MEGESSHALIWNLEKSALFWEKVWMNVSIYGLAVSIKLQFQLN